MRTIIDLDLDLVAELEKTVNLMKEKPATVLRMAIRCGLPLIASAFQAPRPEGYFNDCYPQSAERRQLEDAMLKVVQKPER